MMTFLFWNINKKPLQNTIGELAEIHEIDVLILAECEIERSDLLMQLNSISGPRFSEPYSESKRIVIYTRFPDSWLIPIAEEGELSIRHLENPVSDTHTLIVAAHLPSRMHRSEQDLMQLAPRWRQFIEDAEKRVGHKRTIVVGDLNMNPFDPGVISGEGLHGIMDKRIVGRGSRKVDGQDRDFFYNPMWSLLGDESVGPPGTYYYDASSNPLNYYWHTFDQVLLRPELVPLFPREALRVLTDTESNSLMNNRGIPDSNDISDHFPLLFRLNI